MRARGATIGAARCIVLGIPAAGLPHPRCYRCCIMSSIPCSSSATGTSTTSAAALATASSTTGRSPLPSMPPSAHHQRMRRTRWARGQQAAARLQETLSKFFLALGVLLFLLSCELAFASACCRRTGRSASTCSSWSLVLSGACPTLRGTSCSMRFMAMVTRMLRRWRTQARRS